MYSTSVFACIMTMIFINIFYQNKFDFEHIFTNVTVFRLTYDLESLFDNDGITLFFSKLIISTACSLKDIQRFFMQSSP